MALYLVIKTDENVTLQELHQGSIVIGRSKKANVVIADSNLSSRHLQIDVGRDLSIKYTDLESTNGTHVNNINRKSGPLYIGDVIQIGSTKIKISIEHLTPQEKKALKNPKKSGATRVLSIKEDKPKKEKEKEKSINFEVNIPDKEETASYKSKDKTQDISLETNSAVEVSKDPKQNTIIKKLQEEGYEESGGTKFIKLSDLKNSSTRKPSRSIKSDRVKKYNKAKSQKNKNILSRVVGLFKKDKDEDND